MPGGKSAGGLPTSKPAKPSCWDPIDSPFINFSSNKLCSSPVKQSDMRMPSSWADPGPAPSRDRRPERSPLRNEARKSRARPDHPMLDFVPASWMETGADQREIAPRGLRPPMWILLAGLDLDLTWEIASIPPSPVLQSASFLRGLFPCKTWIGNGRRHRSRTSTLVIQNGNNVLEEARKLAGPISQQIGGRERHLPGFSSSFDDRWRSLFKVAR